MSSFAAVLRRDGVSADPRAVDAMLEAVAFRAPDGRFSHLAGPVGLGLGLLHTARDGLAVDADGLAAALDGRFDHRADLAGKLGVMAPASDVDLLLMAYRRWGPEVIQQLEGDFAFVLWDPTIGRLLVARDPLGVRPVYYHESPDGLWVASHPAAVAAAVPAIGQALDDSVAAAFAAGFIWPQDRTILSGLRRLPPGCTLLASGDAAIVKQAFEWRISPRRNGAEPPERFAALLSAAVAEQMETPARVGALLSGGLDSSSIVVLAVRELRARGATPLRTYSQVFPTQPGGDERPYIEMIVDQGGVDPVYVEERESATFSDYPSFLDEQYLPAIAPNIATFRRTLALAARDGVRVILDGHGGDETVSHGYSHLRDLAYRLRVIALWCAVKDYAEANGHSAWKMFRANLRRHGPWRRGKAPPRPATPWLADGCIPLCADEPPAVPGDEARTEHLVDVAGPYSVQANEMLHHVASAVGIELRFPMLDRRLIEWCVAAPGGEKFARGISRLLLREGMAGLLPEAVRWRSDKHDFTGNVARGLVRDADAVEQALADREGRLARFFNLQVLTEYWDVLREAPDAMGGFEVHALWRAVLLSRWLERHGGESTERGT